MDCDTSVQKMSNRWEVERLEALEVYLQWIVTPCYLKCFVAYKEGKTIWRINQVKVHSFSSQVMEHLLLQHKLPPPNSLLKYLLPAMGTISFLLYILLLNTHYFLAEGGLNGSLEGSSFHVEALSCCDSFNIATALLIKFNSFGLKQLQD